jgi:hypothetical protein
VGEAGRKGGRQGIIGGRHAARERDRIQLGKPVAAVGAAKGNRNVVVDQLTTTAVEDRRAVLGQFGFP